MSHCFAASFHWIFREYVPMTEADTDDAPEHNIRGPLRLLLAQMACWKCARPMKVGAFAGVAGTEVWVDDALPPRWLPLDEGTELSRVNAVCEQIVQVVRERLPTLHPAFSHTFESSYWMNHCAHCGMGTGDFYTQSPSGPFFAWPRSKRDGIDVVDLGVGTLSAEQPYVIPSGLATGRRSRVPRV
jgi:hypothetical protein